MTKSLMENLFKIRKINYYGKDIQGVVAPYLSNNYFCNEIAKDVFYFVTLDGRKMQLNTNEVTLSSTKITDAETKVFFNEIILKAKEAYKIQKSLIKLKQKEIILNDNIHKNEIQITEMQKDFLKKQGYLNDEECLNYLQSNITMPNDYELICDFLGLKIRNVSLQKNVDIDKEIYFKKDFDELKDIYFKSIPKSIIDGYHLDSFYANIPGKNNTYRINHFVSLSLGENIDRKKEMLDKKVIPILNKVIDLFKKNNKVV